MNAATQILWKYEENNRPRVAEAQVILGAAALAGETSDNKSSLEEMVQLLSRLPPRGDPPSLPRAN